MSQPNEFPEHSEGAKIDFLQNEIDLCNTFLDLAYIEVDDAPARVKAGENARQAYKTAQQWVGAIQDSQARERLLADLAVLDKRFEDLANDDRQETTNSK